MKAKDLLKSVPTAHDPNVIKQGNDVTILAPSAEVAIDFDPKETNN